MDVALRQESPTRVLRLVNLLLAPAWSQQCWRWPCPPLRALLYPSVGPGCCVVGLNADEVCPVEPRARQIRTAEVGLAEARPAQVCPLAMGVTQVGVRQARFTEIGFPQVDVLHAASFQVGARYPGAGEVGVAQVGIAQHRVRELHPAQVNTVQEELRLVGVPRAACEHMHGGLDIDRAVRQPGQLVIDFLSWGVPGRWASQQARARDRGRRLRGWA